MAPRTPKNPSKATVLDAVIEAAQVKTRVVLKKKDFTDRAIERSGVRKSDAKIVVEATLAVLAEALAHGEELILPPLGKLKVTREKSSPRGRILLLRLSLEPEGQGGSEPLAEAAE